LFAHGKSTPIKNIPVSGPFTAPISFSDACTMCSCAVSLYFGR
jgi:hypothetical protein